MTISIFIQICVMDERFTKTKKCGQVWAARTESRGAKNTCRNCTTVRIVSCRCCLCLALDSYNQFEIRSQNLVPVLFRVLSRCNVRQSCKTVTIPVFKWSLYPLIYYSRCLLWLLSFDSEPYCFSNAVTFVPALRLLK